jgi:hypothetical protein
MPKTDSGDINIVSVERVYNKSTNEYKLNYTENQLISYSPSEINYFDANNSPSNISFISVGGFTNYMYSLMEFCEI